MSGILPPVLLISSILLGALGQVFFKMGIDSITAALGLRFYLAAARNPWILLGFFLYGISFLLWMAVLRFYDLGFARPLTAAGYLVTYLMAVLLLGEALTPARLAGVVCLCLGVVLLNLQG